MKRTHYEDKYFYYFWKPAWVASVFWEQKSFLDYIDFLLTDKKEQNENILVYTIFLYLQDMFGRKGEYGLVNRLDNDTSWLLYFAKTPLFKQKYKQIQQEILVSKYYLVDVCGLMDIDKLVTKNNSISMCVYNELSEFPVIKISLPIIHHKTDKKKMFVSLFWDQDLTQLKAKYVDTYVSVLYQDKYNKETTLLVCINKWVRHQIRLHLSSIWFPIVWEKLYSKQRNIDHLHLYSIWQKI